MRGILTIIWALLVAALGWFAVNSKAPEIQQDILTRSTEAVKPLNANADVLVDGRFVTLRGPEPSEEAKAKTLAAAGEVYGALGPTDGLWVPAVSKVLEFLSAEKKSDGSLTLAGLVPSDEARAAAETAAKAVFSGAIDNQLTVSGNGDPVSKLPDLGDALKALSGLDIGSLTATADRIRLAGVAANQGAADTANALQAAAPDLIQAFVQAPAAAAAGAPGRLALIKSPDGSITASGEVPTEESRTSLLDAFKAGNPAADVIDRLSVRPDGLDAGWADRALAGAKALTGLDWGNLSLEGARSYLSGMAPQDLISGITGGLGSGFTADIAARPDDPNAAKIGQLEGQIGGLASELDAARKAASDAEAAAKKRIDELLAQLAAAQQPAPVPAPATPAAPAAPAVAASDEETSKTCNTAVAGILQGARIEFDTAKATIRPEGLELIGKLLEAAKPCLGNPALRVTVGGHTDSRGEEAANLKLSQERAEAVKTVLASRGVAANDITAIGFGESMPIADNATEEGQQANRRITIEWSLR